MRTREGEPHGARLAGALGEIAAGDRIAVTATWSTHPKYGPTLQAGEVERLGVDERGAVIDVLRATRHIGPSYARRWWSGSVKVRSRRSMRRPRLPSRRCLVWGPSAPGNLPQSWRRDAAKRPLRLLLARHRVGWLTDRLFKELGPQAVDRITADPYALTCLHGVGIRTADQIARAVGVEPAGPERARAILIEVLREAAMRQGHVALPVEEARARADALGLQPPPSLPEDLGELADGRLLVLRDGLIADGVLWRREESVAKGLRRIAGPRRTRICRRSPCPIPSRSVAKNSMPSSGLRWWPRSSTRSRSRPACGYR